MESHSWVRSIAGNRVRLYWVPYRIDVSAPFVPFEEEKSRGSWLQIAEFGEA